MDFTITDRKSIQAKRKSLTQERQKMEEQKMELEALRKDMIAAMKAKDKVTKEAVSALIAAVKKAAIDEGCRDDIKGELVDKVILKELKTAKEQIDTCPAERTDLKEEYQARYDIIAKYAPKQMDEAEIKAYIEEKFADVLATGNKGQIMKAVMGDLKGKADGKLIVIDGGFCRAYQKTTGIAGYTLIYNSYGMRLISHGPFTSVQQAIEDNQDILSTSKIFEVLDRRCTVEYTDTGADIKEQIESLKKLLDAYRTGIIKEAEH